MVFHIPRFKAAMWSGLASNGVIFLKESQAIQVVEHVASLNQFLQQVRFNYKIIQKQVWASFSFGSCVIVKILCELMAVL